MTHDLILQAISGRRLVFFQYHGKERLAEPHDYGIQHGARRLLAFQVGGESSTGRLPSWRLIDVDDIERLGLTNRRFPGNRSTPSGQHHKWDALFARVGED